MQFILRKRTLIFLIFVILKVLWRKKFAPKLPDSILPNIYDVTDINLTNQLEVPESLVSASCQDVQQFQQLFIDDYHCIFRYYLVFLII